nr:MAG TPA: hypothetical protein [Bacteriophage sp.]
MSPTILKSNSKCFALMWLSIISFYARSKVFLYINIKIIDF